MTTEAYSRASAREVKTWKPFVYQFPLTEDQIEERATVYGLYSHSHANQIGYLREIENTELLNLLNNYNSQMAQLTTQEQVLIAEIVSKRYLAGIDKLVHDQKLATKSAKIGAEDAEWDAKIAALAADSAALETIAAKVTAETEKNTARIAELEAYIETESYNLSAVDIQMVEKAIESAKTDIEILNAANAVLKIQAETVAKATELVEIDLRIARTKVDIANTERSTAKIDLLQNDLSIEKARTEIEEAELPIAASRVTLAGLKTDEVEAEIEHIDTEEEQAATNYANKIDLMDVKQAGRIDTLAMKQQEKDLELDNKLDLSALNISFVNADKTLQQTIDAKKVTVMDNKVANLWLKYQAEIEVQEALAATNITSTLIHTIAKKT